MSFPNYIAKTKAIAELQSKTGRGRRIVENAMDALEEKGRIHIEPDPFDKRILRMSLEDMELVRRVLMGEEPV
jgi:DNA-binding MarR family transcriptional regulator